MTSVRFGSIRWLKDILDHLSQEVMKVLGRPNVKADARGDLGDAFVVRVQDGGSEGKLNDAVVLPSFCYQIDELNRSAGVSYFPPLTPNRQLAPAAYHNLILAHNQLHAIHQVEKAELVQRFASKSRAGEA